jgi:hypothetical protein
MRSATDANLACDSKRAPFQVIREIGPTLAGTGSRRVAVMGRLGSRQSLQIASVSHH